MNDKIRKQFDIHNPFVFKHISNLRSIEDFQDNGPCVIMASPGMLQSGLSKELFELWCQDSKNGVIIAGYSVDGTLAKKIMSEPDTVTLSNGNTVPLRMTVRTISFSAHSDRAQTEEFIGTIKPPHIILVHGDLANCNRLKQSLQGKFPESKVYAPKNCTSINIMFQGEKRAKVLGQLAMKKYEDGDEINGILLHHNFQHLLLNEKDLKLYSDVCCSGVKQTLLVPLNDTVPYEQIIRKIFSNVTVEYENKETENGQLKSETMDTSDDKKEDVKYVPITFSDEKPVVIIIDGAVRIELRLQEKTPCGLIEWPSSAANDTIVDSLCNLVLYTEKSYHDSILEEGKDELKMLYCIQQMLKEHFGECTCRLS